MENITSLIKYNTDVNGSWGIGHYTIDITKNFDYVLNDAIGKKATIIVKPSRGKFWYIKGINNKKTYQEIKSHIESNKNNKYKENSHLWLISY